MSNAGCRDKDIPLMENKLKELKANGKDIDYVQRDDLALLAVQGPKAQQVVQPLVDVDLSKMYFMNSAAVRVCGFNNCRITRCGYTGEDGFEISVPARVVAAVTDALVESEVAKVKKNLNRHMPINCYCI